MGEQRGRKPEPAPAKAGEREGANPFPLGLVRAPIRAPGRMGGRSDGPAVRPPAVLSSGRSVSRRRTERESKESVRSVCPLQVCMKPSQALGLPIRDLVEVVSGRCREGRRCPPVRLDGGDGGHRGESGGVGIRRPGRRTAGFFSARREWKGSRSRSRRVRLPGCRMDESS